MPRTRKPFTMRSAAVFLFWVAVVLVTVPLVELVLIARAPDPLLAAVTLVALDVYLFYKVT